MTTNLQLKQGTAGGIIGVISLSTEREYVIITKNTDDTANVSLPW